MVGTPGKYAILAVTNGLRSTPKRTISSPPQQESWNRSHFSYVITSARCVTLGRTGPAGGILHYPSRRAQPAAGDPSFPPPGRLLLGTDCASGRVREGQGLEEAHARPRAPRLQPFSREPARRLEPPPAPSAGAEPRPTRWGPVSHFPWRSGPRPAARGPCSPGHLPLEPHLSLSFLTCSRLSPVLSLTPK